MGHRRDTPYNKYERCNTFANTYLRYVNHYDVWESHDLTKKNYGPCFHLRLRSPMDRLTFLPWLLDRGRGFVYPSFPV